MPKSTLLATQVLNAALRGLAFTSPIAIYMALYKTAPSISGGGIEVSGGSYARQAVTFVVPSGGQTQNSSDILFPIASADWGTLVAYGLFDALTGGSLLYFSVLSNPRTVLTDDQIKFTAGQVAVIET